MYFQVVGQQGLPCLLWGCFRGCHGKSVQGLAASSSPGSLRALPRPSRLHAESWGPAWTLSSSSVWTPPPHHPRGFLHTLKLEELCPRGSSLWPGCEEACADFGQTCAFKNLIGTRTLAADLVSLFAKKSRFNSTEVLAYSALCVKHAMYWRPNTHTGGRRVSQMNRTRPGTRKFKCHRAQAGDKDA